MAHATNCGALLGLGCSCQPLLAREVNSQPTEAQRAQIALADLAEIVAAYVIEQNHPSDCPCPLCVGIDTAMKTITVATLRERGHV